MTDNRRYVFRILIDNEAGALDRVVGVFSSRGCNIESLNVAEVDEKNEISMITVIIRGDGSENKAVLAKLNVIVPVHHVDITAAQDLEIEREFALIRLKDHTDVSNMVDMRTKASFIARQLDTDDNSIIIQCAGTVSEIDQYIQKISSLEITDISRTGLITVEKKKEG